MWLTNKVFENILNKYIFFKYINRRVFVLLTRKKMCTLEFCFFFGDEIILVTLYIHTWYLFIKYFLCHSLYLSFRLNIVVFLNTFQCYFIGSCKSFPICFMRGFSLMTFECKFSEPPKT